MTANRGGRRCARVCSALDSDWRQMATSALGRTAVQRWVDQDPCFEGAHSAHDVLARCERAPLRAGPVLRALLRVATGERFAQQTAEVAKLRAENERLRSKLAQAEVIIGVQGKVHALLEEISKRAASEES